MAQARGGASELVCSLTHFKTGYLCLPDLQHATRLSNLHCSDILAYEECLATSESRQKVFA